MADGDGAVLGDGRRDLGRLRTRLILAFAGVLLPRETIIKPQIEQMRRESKERS